MAALALRAGQRGELSRRSKVAGEAGREWLGLDISVYFLLLLHFSHAAPSALLVYLVHFSAKQTLMEASCYLTVGANIAKLS